MTTSNRCNRPLCGALMPGSRKSLRCANCQRLMEQARRHRDPELWKKKSREKSSRGYRENPEIYRAAARRTRAKLRQEFIEVYGGKCTCCGEAEPAFLTLEHVRRDGAKHRALVGDYSDAVLRDLKKRMWPKDDYTILCFNCNRARWVMGRCPHEKKLWRVA